MTRAARISKKPKLTVDLKEFREMGTEKESLDLIQGQIAKLDKRITAKQAYMDKLTYPWKKVKVLKELPELVNRRTALEDSLAKTVKKWDIPMYSVLRKHIRNPWQQSGSMKKSMQHIKRLWR